MTAYPIRLTILAVCLTVMTADVAHCEPRMQPVFVPPPPPILPVPPPEPKYPRQPVPKTKVVCPPPVRTPSPPPGARTEPWRPVPSPPPGARPRPTKPTPCDYERDRERWRAFDEWKVEWRQRAQEYRVLYREYNRAANEFLRRLDAIL